MGVLFRKGAALETLARMDTVVLDKTGTLTRGRPELTDFIVLFDHDEGNENEVLQWVAAVEAQSEHPIAEAIVSGARSRGLEFPAVSHFRAEPGYGIEAEVAGHKLHVGADRYMSQLGIGLESVEERANALAEKASTRKTILGNFVWAYGYNLALIPVAAGVLFPFTGFLLNPMLAAGAMSLSSVFVLTNSLRLRRFKPDTDKPEPTGLEESKAGQVRHA